VCGLLGGSTVESALVLSFSAHIQVRFAAAQLNCIPISFSFRRCVLFPKNSITSCNILHAQELQEAWARLVPFGSIPTEQNFKTFFEATDARDFSGPADSQTISQRYTLSFFFLTGICFFFLGLFDPH
jgi:hypothetical protein